LVLVEAETWTEKSPVLVENSAFDRGFYQSLEEFLKYLAIKLLLQVDLEEIYCFKVTYVRARTINPF